MSQKFRKQNIMLSFFCVTTMINVKRFDGHLYKKPLSKTKHDIKSLYCHTFVTRTINNMYIHVYKYSMLYRLPFCTHTPSMTITTKQ